jgi:hypothetical protein
MRRLVPCLFVALLALPAVAADPLRLIPKDATLVLKVENPRRLVESITSLDVYQQYQHLPQVREVFDSTPARRFFQLVRHAETKLDKKWPVLLDALAGGGLAVGTVTGKDPAPAVLVAQGTDEPTAKAAFRLFVELLSDEIARQTNGAVAGPEKLTKGDAEGVRLGAEFLAVRIGSAIVVSSRGDGFDKLIELAAAKTDAGSLAGVKSVAAAKAALPADPLAWVWFDLAKAKEEQAFKDFLDTARKQAFLLFVVGGTVDAVRRAGFVAAGLYQTPAGLKLSVRLPAKRADLEPVFALHAPLTGDAPGSLPLLAPPGVLYSQSFYLDVGSFWKNRKTALGEQELKDLEQADKDVSKFLPGTTLGKLLEMSGPHHRLVAVERGENQYQTVPDFPLPEMAVVSSMRDAKFGQTMKTTLRTAAAVASLSLGMKMSEEKVGDIDVVSYRFAEGKPLDADPTNLRFNFVPSFAVVNDSLVVASSPRLLKDLLPELTKPIEPSKCSPAVWRNRVYGVGAATAVKARPDTIVSDAVLGQGLGLDEAKKRIDQLAKFLAALGTVGVELDHGAEAFKVDVEWKAKN